MPTDTIAAVVLFVLGYPVAVGVLLRFRAVLAERRTRWFTAHQLAMLAISGGWLLLDNLVGVAINGSWFLVAAVLWLRP